MKEIIPHVFERNFVVTDDSLANTLKAESGTRRKIFNLLYEEGEMSPSKIARALHVSKTTVLYHVRKMWKKKEIKFARTQQVGNLVEKYFTASAERLDIPLPETPDISPGGKYESLYEDIENCLHELYLVLARNYRDELPRGDMMELTNVLIGMMLYALISDARNLIIHNNKKRYWDETRRLISVQRIIEDFEIDRKQNSILLRVYDGLKYATKIYIQENQDTMT